MMLHCLMKMINLQRAKFKRDLENQSDQTMQEASPLCLNFIEVTQNITQ